MSVNNVPYHDYSFAAGHDPAATDGSVAPGRSGCYLWVKAVTDFVLALTLLGVTAPLLVVIAMLVKLTSRGPVLYRQIRLGRHGRPYAIYKIRTMIHDCESLTGARWAIPGDPRVTALGRFLRRSHLDELPQLWNVVCGQMSLVGPRPERPEFVGQLEHAIPRYRDRLRVRPGITGLAQVQLPADTDLESVRRKLAYDLYYVERLSLWLDLRLVLCTALWIVGIPFAIGCRLFLVPGREAVGQPNHVIPVKEEPLFDMGAAGESEEAASSGAFGSAMQAIQ